MDGNLRLRDRGHLPEAVDTSRRLFLGSEFLAFSFFASPTAIVSGLRGVAAALVHDYGSAHA
jgi:hypothetical protein